MVLSFFIGSPVREIHVWLIGIASLNINLPLYFDGQALSGWLGTRWQYILHEFARFVVAYRSSLLRVFTFRWHLFLFKL